jgi:hypothetical protein
MSAATTLWPSSTSLRTMPAPIPSAEPVTTAIFVGVVAFMSGLPFVGETIEQKPQSKKKTFQNLLFVALTL